MDPAPRQLPVLFHIVADEAWRQAQADGELRPASLAEEGFVHCSFQAQLAGTLQRHFPGPDGLLVLSVDPALLDAPIHVEDSYGSGQAFPHVYGPIPAAAVTAVAPARDLIAAAGPPDGPGRASADR